MQVPKVSRTLGRKLLFLPPVIAGVAVCGVFVRSRATPDRVPEQEASRALRVIAAPEVAVMPRALGCGTARPARVWQAVAEVKGRVTEVHAELRPGTIVKQGAVLLRIDPTEYELAISRLTAEIAQAMSQVEQLETKRANHESAAKLERASLLFAEKQLDRLRLLRKSSAVSGTEVDAEERKALAQRQAVQSLESALSLIPSERKSAEATLAAKRATLASAKLDLAKTVISAPFDCRLGPVSIEAGQFLGAGQALFEAHGIGTIEVEAQVALHHMRRLLRQPGEPPDMRLDMDALRKAFSIEAIVRFQSGDFQAEWLGRFARIREARDARTRTVGAVVAVDRPYERAVLGKKPPPLPGTFCEVELRGKPRPAQVIVPRTALCNGDSVYVVGTDNRLARRQVAVAFAQSGFVVVESGLQAGETVVVTEPVPAVEGMLVEPIPDVRVLEHVRAEARGEGNVR